MVMNIGKNANMETLRPQFYWQWDVLAGKTIGSTVHGDEL
jgi:hypothetical protein